MLKLSKCVLVFSGARPVGGLSPSRTDLSVCGSVDLCCLSLTSSFQELHWTSKSHTSVSLFLFFEFLFFVFGMWYLGADFVTWQHWHRVCDWNCDTFCDSNLGYVYYVVMFVSLELVFFFKHSLQVSMLKFSSSTDTTLQSHPYCSLARDVPDKTHITHRPLFSLLQNFLDNFPTSDVMVFVARTLLLFQMITVYPLLGYLVRVQMMGQMFGNHYPR